MVSLAEAVAIASRHYQAGDLAGAESVARQILAAQPHNPDALHLLGMLALQDARFAEAVDLIAKAVALDGSRAPFFANLGEAYLHLGRSPEAIACFERAVALQPQLAIAHARLGKLHHGQGRSDEAVTALRRALELQPRDTATRRFLGRVLFERNELDQSEACYRAVLEGADESPDAHYDLGSVVHRAQKLAEAEAHYRAALVRDPRHAGARNNLGALLREQGQFDEARAFFEAAMQSDPRDAVAAANLADVHLAQGDLDAATQWFRRLLEVDPRSVRALDNLGTLAYRRGNLQDARALFQKAVQIDPRSPEFLIKLGNVLQMLGEPSAAMECFQAAIRLAPTMAAAHNSLGVAWNDLGRRDEAIESYRRAIELDPGLGEPYNNLGVSLQSLGRMAEATACFRKAVELIPNGGAHHSNLLYSLNYDAGYDAVQLFAEHRDWGRRYADPLTQRSEPHANDRTPDRRLRVGYVSANFRDQAVNFFSEPILASHDHRQFEVFCYSDVARPDATTERLRGYADHWRPILGEADQRVAALVRRDQIDVLVDLAGHIGDNRLLMFARKPAPVQVTYIGYQNTTGMAAMDYRLTDDYADPPGTTDAYYTERLVRLPRSFFCYLPSTDAPDVMPSPSLQNGYVTFGSFNIFYKVGPAVLDAWATILTRVPRSRLVILANVVPSLQERLAKHFTARGIGPDRWELAGRRPRRDYLELIARADVALDPFPFNGHTTTCDALWQGVPTVTLSGNSYVSRFGGSGLATLGLNELIAHDVSEYVRIASALAGDVARPAELRSTLRRRMADSPLLDFAGFTRNLEAAYRQMWTHWCAGAQ